MSRLWKHSYWLRSLATSSRTKNARPHCRRRLEIEALDRRELLTGDFLPAVSYPVESEPLGVAVGDVNEDGRADLAVSNTSGNSVSILLGTGTGTFGPSTNVPAGLSPLSLLLADLNTDGHLDLVTTNYVPTAATVSVMLGAGNGTFGAPTSVAVGDNPLAIRLGDFNGDGRPDLAVANQFSNSVSVLMGNGDGTFGARYDTPVGSEPFALAVADLNDDGFADLAVTDNDNDRVWVLLGLGDGMFSPATRYSVGDQPRGVAIADLNNDGYLDLAVPNSYSHSVSILLGIGGGAFGSSSNYSAGPYGDESPWGTAIADFDGDGKLDVAVANWGGNDIGVLHGNGLGGFAPGVTYPLSPRPQSLAVGDFNGDGRPDVAAPAAYENRVWVLLNANNSGTNASPSPLTDIDGTPNRVADGAFNGTPVGVKAFATDPNNDTLTYTLVNNGGGLFAIHPSTGVITVGDGSLLDYDVTTSYTVTVQVSDGHGGVSSADFNIDVTPAPVPHQFARLRVEIQQLAAAGNLNNGNANSLFAKLKNAEASYSHGNLTTATNQLNAFVNEVNALLKAKKLSPGTAGHLLLRASTLLASLNP